ncbi:short-chain dehydrogenase [Bordetella ansorpii]|uniref:Short-chain dehydrogenase n=1 Tax=Bordetella ansorpii TaxID=288768 RepID=A0A157MG40_9BORD|nr:SDR family NAD(P)-dependent oxidoreductase [Bordetella ansorpii]SAI07684.1 short-chain dehydrogenase [Bordetella ansorpii]
MPSLAGKKAFVTGASRGIGAAIARRLAAEGADVAIGYERSAEAADTLAAEIRRGGRRAVAVRMSASEPASVKQAVDRAAFELGGLDILINNAGIFRGGPVEGLTLQEVDEVLAVNVRAVVLASHAALAHLPEGGRIVSIGSNLATRVPDAGMSLYALSKSALIGWTQGLARDLGPRGITVNLVHPGSTDTDMNPADGPQAAQQAQRMAIKRYGKADDVAALVAFVAGPQAGSINGAGLTVDGGANA